MTNVEKEFNVEQLVKYGFSVIENKFKNEIYAEWYREYFKWLIAEKLKDIENIALGMMEDSIKNRRMKSMDLVSHGNYITISTFPCSGEEARSRFYPDGYFKYVNYLIKIAWNLYSTSHFMHIQFFENGNSFEIMITLLPNRKLINFSPIYLFPSEFLRKNKLKIKHKKNVLVFYEESFMNKILSIKFWVNNFKNLLKWFKSFTPRWEDEDEFLR